MFTALTRVYMLLSLAIGQHSGLGHDGMEPRCMSRFDWDYKVLQKLSDLESEIKLLKSSPSQDCSCNCKDGWIQYKGKCYFFLTSRKSYIEAINYCAYQGGKLAEPLTVCENEFLKSMARQFKTEIWWLGLNDEETEGKWVWHSSGKSPSYTDWVGKEPNQGKGANCGGLWHYNEFGWMDAPCSSVYYAICEI